MIIYHGTHSVFKKFSLEKAREVATSFHQQQGEGIYFSDNPSICKGYGSTIKKVEVDPNCITDFTQASVIEQIYIDINNIVGDDNLYQYVPNNILIDDIKDSILKGEANAEYLFKNIALWLDNNGYELTDNDYINLEAYEVDKLKAFKIYNNNLGFNGGNEIVIRDLTLIKYMEDATNE